TSARRHMLKRTSILALAILTSLALGCSSEESATPRDTTGPGAGGQGGAGNTGGHGGGNDTSASTGGAASCHQNGEPFTPPAGVTDPWQLYMDGLSEICCDPAAGKIVLVETPSNGACERPDTLQFACVIEAGDGSCGSDENFCTSPRDCPPP